MNALTIQIQIKSLELQLRVLKAQLATLTSTENPKKRMADLYGILAGKSDSTEEQIKAAEYHFQWEDETEEENL